MRLGSRGARGAAGPTWREARRNPDKITSGLNAATSALSRAVEARSPSRISVLRVLLQCQLALAAAESSSVAFSPGKSFVEAAKQMALAALWCNLRLGARGGPIRRRALDCIRRAGKLAGAFTLMQILADLQEYMTKRESSTADDGAATDANAAAAAVMGELVRGVTRMPREEASDAVMYLLGRLGRSTVAAKEEAATAAASIVMSFTVEAKVLDRAAEWALAEAQSTGPCAAVLAVSVASLLDARSASEEFAKSCAKTLATVAQTELEQRLWGVAVAKATIASIAQEMPSGLKKARVGDNEYQEALARLIRSCGISGSRPGSHWPLIAILQLWRKRMQYGSRFIQLSIETLAPHLDSYQTLALGTEIIYIGLLKGQARPVLSELLLVLAKELDSMTRSSNYVSAALGLSLVAAGEIIRQLGPDVSALQLREEIQLTQDQEEEQGFSNVVECSVPHKLRAAARIAIEDETNFVQEGGATLLAALAYAAPLTRATILTETIENLRLADMDLATNPYRCDSYVYKNTNEPNMKALLKLTGNALAIALLVDESTDYPGVPSALLEQCVEDAQALLKPHSLCNGEPPAAVTAKRRQAGWTLITALGGSAMSKCFTEHRINSLLPFWIAELSLTPAFDTDLDPVADIGGQEVHRNGDLTDDGDRLNNNEATSGVDDEDDDEKQVPISSENNYVRKLRPKRRPISRISPEDQAAIRAAALAALHAALLRNRTRDLEVTAMALLGAEAVRLTEHSNSGHGDELLQLPELKRLLSCVGVLSPGGSSKEFCYHVALLAEKEVARARKRQIKALKKARNRRKHVKDETRESLMWSQNNILGLFNAENLRNSDVNEWLHVSASALASIVCTEIEDCGDFLEEVVERRMELSKAFIAAVSFEIVQRLTVADLFTESRIMISLQVLLKRVLVSEVFGQKPEFISAAMSTMEYLFGRYSESGGSGRLYLAEGTVRTLTDTYSELGKKGGIQLWNGLVKSLADLVKNNTESNSEFAAAGCQILGGLLSTPFKEVHGWSPDAKQDHPSSGEQMSVYGVEALASGLENGDVDVQVAAALALSKGCIGVTELAERLLCGLLDSMLLEKGSGEVQVHLKDSELMTVRVDPEGSGDSLAAIGEGTAAVLLACKGLRWWKLDEPVQESTREIAAELISWKVDRAPRNRAAGLTCIAGVWSAINATAQQSSNDRKGSLPVSSARHQPELLALRDFWSEELPEETARKAICETLTRHDSAELSDARDAAVSAVTQLVLGAGVRPVLDRFHELPEALFMALEAGCESAAEALELLAVAHGPHRFAFWLQLCRNIYFGGLKGVRTNGAGGLFEVAENDPEATKEAAAKPAKEMQSPESPVPLREVAKYAKWEGDWVTRGIAVHILRVVIDAVLNSSSKTRPDHVSLQASSQRTVSCWVEERLIEHVGRVCQIAIAACRSSTSSSMAATEGATILRILVPTFAKVSDGTATGSSRLLDSYAAQISSALRDLLVSPQMPEVVRSSALAAAGIILTSCKVPNLGEEKLLKALFGNETHKLHKRFQYDILAEQAGARTTVSVLCSIGLVLTEAVRCEYTILLSQLSVFFPTLCRLFIAFAGDFAAMFGRGPSDIGVNGGALTVAGTPTTLIQTTFVKNVADIVFALASLRRVLTTDHFDYNDPPIDWVCPESPGAVFASRCPSVLFNEETRTVIIAAIVWWARVGLSKSADELGTRKHLRDDALERCVFALDVLRQWPNLEPDIEGLEEALRALASVDISSASKLAHHIILDPRADERLKVLAREVCVYALHEMTLFDRRDFLRQRLPIAALEALAFELLRSHDGSMESLLCLALDGLHMALDNNNLDSTSLSLISAPASHFLRAFVTNQKAAGGRTLECARRLCATIQSRVEAGSESPESMEGNISILCSFASVCQEYGAVDAKAVITVTLQAIEFCISSAQAIYNDAVLNSYSVKKVLMGSINEQSGYALDDSFAEVWSRIGVLALREKTRSGSVVPDLGSSAINQLETGAALSLLLDAENECRSSSSGSLKKFHEVILSLTLPALMGSPAQIDADEFSLAEIATGSPVLFAHCAEQYQGARRELLSRILIEARQSQ